MNWLSEICGVQKRNPMAEPRQKQMEQQLVQHTADTTSRSSAMVALKQLTSIVIYLTLLSAWGFLLISANIYQTQLMAATLIIGFAALMSWMNPKNTFKNNS